MTVADIFRYSKVERLEAPDCQRGVRTGFRTGGSIRRWIVSRMVP